jgi:hypothetical protein
MCEQCKNMPMSQHLDTPALHRIDVARRYFRSANLRFVRDRTDAGADAGREGSGLIMTKRIGSAWVAFLPLAPLVFAYPNSSTDAGGCHGVLATCRRN